jgi:hypothetical protein
MSRKRDDMPLLMKNRVAYAVSLKKGPVLLQEIAPVDIYRRHHVHVLELAPHGDLECRVLITTALSVHVLAFADFTTHVELMINAPRKLLLAAIAVRAKPPGRGLGSSYSESTWD